MKATVILFSDDVIIIPPNQDFKFQPVEKKQGSVV
jgi:hypothetical protein